MPNKGDYGGGTEVDKQQMKVGESVCVIIVVVIVVEGTKGA